MNIRKRILFFFLIFSILNIHFIYAKENTQINCSAQAIFEARFVDIKDDNSIVLLILGIKKNVFLAGIENDLNIKDKEYIFNCLKGKKFYVIFENFKTGSVYIWLNFPNTFNDYEAIEKMLNVQILLRNYAKKSDNKELLKCLTKKVHMLY